MPPGSVAIQVTRSGPANETIALGPVVCTRGGAPSSGITALEGGDGGLSPMAFVAVTVNVYAVPFARPLISKDRWLWSMANAAPPGDAVIVYDVSGLPPSLGGGCHVTTAPWFDGVAWTAVGAVGAVGPP